MRIRVATGAALVLLGALVVGWRARGGPGAGEHVSGTPARGATDLPSDLRPLAAPEEGPSRILAAAARRVVELEIIVIQVDGAECRELDAELELEIGTLAGVRVEHAALDAGRCQLELEGPARLRVLSMRLHGKALDLARSEGVSVAEATEAVLRVQVAFLAVHVVDAEDGSPLRDLRHAYRSEESLLEDGVGYEHPGDALGECRLGHAVASPIRLPRSILSEGSQRLYVSAPYHAWSSVRLSAKSDEAPLTLALSRAGSLEVRIQGKGGTLEPATRILAWKGREAGHHFPELDIATHGWRNVVVDHLRPGEYTVALGRHHENGESDWFSETPCVVKPGEVTLVDLDVQ